MGKVKTQKEVQAAVEEGLKKPQSLYNKCCVNWTGKLNENQEPYINYIAKLLIDNIEKIRRIKPIERKKLYSNKDRNGNIERITNRGEEIFAKILFNSYKDKNFSDLGKIIDYQIPLKADAKKDSESTGVGKVDLFSFSEERKKIYFIELKAENAKDTLLRCILEAYTYTRQVNYKKFCDSYDCLKQMKNEEQDDVIVPIVMIFEGSKAHNMYKNENSQYSNVLYLADKLHVKFAFIKKDSLKLKTSIEPLKLNLKL